MANTPPSGSSFAIPDFSSTSNSIAVSGEPGTWQCVATGLSDTQMNGTYLTTASHFYFGDINQYGSYKCFSRGGGRAWQSRSASNNYAGNSNYQGSTSIIIGGSTIMGEYITITAPYAITLKSYALSSGSFDGTTFPCSGWVVGGSNDGGSTYALVDQQSGNTTINSNGYDIFTTSNTTSYTTYIIVITNSLNGSAANIINWNIYSLTPGLACFVEGTRIRTQNGDKPIESLSHGDRVVTSDNRTIPFKLMRGIIHKADEENAPYRIAAGALGRNIPSSALCVSPDHKVQLRRGVWTSPRQAATTNSLVRQYGIGQRVVYYHIVCDNYLTDNVIAEGAVCETYATVDAVGGLDNVPKIYTWNPRLNGFTRMGAGSARTRASNAP